MKGTQRGLITASSPQPHFEQDACLRESGINDRLILEPALRDQRQSARRVARISGVVWLCACSSALTSSVSWVAPARGAFSCLLHDSSVRRPLRLSCLRRVAGRTFAVEPWTSPPSRAPYRLIQTRSVRMVRIKPLTQVFDDWASTADRISSAATLIGIAGLLQIVCHPRLLLEWGSCSAGAQPARRGATWTFSSPRVEQSSINLARLLASVGSRATTNALRKECRFNQCLRVMP